METVEPVVNPVVLEVEPTAPSTSKPIENVQETGGEEPTKYEYEFSCVVDGRASFIGLYDTNDLSACERVAHRPMSPKDITYSPTGNGFILDKFGLSYTFKKQPHERSFEMPTAFIAETKVKKSKVQMDVMDILASIDG